MYLWETTSYKEKAQDNGVHRVKQCGAKDNKGTLGTQAEELARGPNARTQSARVATWEVRSRTFLLPWCPGRGIGKKPQIC